MPEATEIQGPANRAFLFGRQIVFGQAKNFAHYKCNYNEFIQQHL
jgi:hypothetical protein